MVASYPGPSHKVLGEGPGYRLLGVLAVLLTLIECSGIHVSARDRGVCDSFLSSDSCLWAFVCSVGGLVTLFQG